MSEQQPNPYASDPGQGAGQDQGDYRWGPGNASYGYPQPYPQPPAYQPTMGGAGLPVPAQPPAPGYAPGAGPSLSLGDISIAGDQIITPSGPMPLRGAMWNATDFSRTEEKIPAHAIVLAVIFFLFCLLGLLFLLMKERRTTGYIQITVNSGGRHHSTMIPATDANSYAWVMSQINYARSLSM
ncbi:MULTISPECIES: hypothetical protein [unclassified Streptomyces]|uniref:hypothetical protein n=1 Tax=unclassified Streptomyces TaxID=2593676 RepID=UPI001BE5D0D4|nr:MULTISPECIES: hypothetical protein [unclassified Streptomyces]MBT2402350.1 hypothetical protein [Streptomyces sp. ISL-21]MBT2455301.1 hypothetical protein [Streptomyces sp. ISL-86]MBT2607682.1 hypothetical protein [Streptomyces sp. ISL-87]